MVNNRKEKEIKNLVHAAIREHEHIHEFRLQRMIYLCELICYVKTGKKISDMEYKLFKGGVYSSDLQNTLENMEKEGIIESMTDKRNNSKTKIYVDRETNSKGIEMTSELREIMNNVLKAIENIQSEELVEWSKKTVSKHSIEYGEKINFEDFEKNSLREELREDFPKLEVIS